MALAFKRCDDTAVRKRLLTNSVFCTLMHIACLLHRHAHVALVHFNACRI